PAVSVRGPPVAIGRERHHGDAPSSGAPLVAAPTRIDLQTPSPQAPAFFAPRLPGPPPPRHTFDVDLGLRIGEEIVVPGRMMKLAVIGGDHDHPLSIGETKQRQRTALATL